MGPEDDDDQADLDISKLLRAENEELFWKYFSAMPREDQIAYEQLIYWVAYDRPKDAEQLTLEKAQELLNDIKRENTRRRLGGGVGIILPFKRPGSDGSTGSKPL